MTTHRHSLSGNEKVPAWCLWPSTERREDAFGVLFVHPDNGTTFRYVPHYVSPTRPISLKRKYLKVRQ